MLGLMLQFIITGIAVGAMYGLVALGFVIIYNVTGVVNFAQGTFPMLGGLIMVSLISIHLPVPLALLASTVAVAITGLLFCAAAVLPFKEARIAPLIVTLGLSLSFEGVAFFGWGFNPLSYRAFTGSRALYVAGAAIYPQALWVIGIALLLVLLTFAFFEYTIVGKAVRACTMTRRGARLLGINVNLMAFIAFAVSAAIGAIVGAVITPLAPMSFTSDVNLAVNGFAAAIFGGLENSMAAVAGGIVLGILGTFAQGLVGNGLDVVVALAVMLIVLVTKPEGAFATLLRPSIATK